MTDNAAQKKPTIDWEAIEREYRTGIPSVRELAARFGVSHTAINKRADKEGWTRESRQSISEKVILQPAIERPAAGFVYVIYIDAPGGRIYKIGMAARFCARFDQHQCASPFEIAVACAFFVGNMRAVEAALHAEFADKRVRGEWFRLSPDDVERLAKRAVLI